MGAKELRILVSSDFFQTWKSSWKPYLCLVTHYYSDKLVLILLVLLFYYLLLFIIFIIYYYFIIIILLFNFISFISFISSHKFDV